MEIYDNNRKGTVESMINNLKKNQYGELEGEVYVPLFDMDMEVSISNESKLAYAERCAEYFCNLPEDVLERFCKYCSRYCEEMRRVLDEEDMPVPEGVEGKEILDYIAPNILIIDEKCDESIIEFHMEMSCDWEIEHGLELTIKDGKILYVGSYDGMPPYHTSRIEYVGHYNPNVDMNMNYADKE